MCLLYVAALFRVTLFTKGNTKRASIFLVKKMYAISISTVGQSSKEPLIFAFYGIRQISFISGHCVLYPPPLWWYFFDNVGLKKKKAQICKKNRPQTSVWNFFFLLCFLRATKTMCAFSKKIKSATFYFFLCLPLGLPGTYLQCAGAKSFRQLIVPMSHN